MTEVQRLACLATTDDIKTIPTIALGALLNLPPTHITAFRDASPKILRANWKYFIYKPEGF